ncbi:hypothetical protein evm_009075 [Chilo suppressalis]|nr:hypothetical protein evm_009075 [Chilo suppressalis]
MVGAFARIAKGAGSSPVWSTWIFSSKIFFRFKRLYHHHQPIDVPTARAQPLPMDGIGRLGHAPPRGPSADCRVLTTADAAGTNGFTDAAWELEQNAFAEIYERPLTCNVEDCLCPMGRKHCAETGLWDIKLCLLCGSAGVHEGCTDEDISTYICRDCISAAPKEPDELAKLAATIDQVIASEQATVSTTRARHPVMPSRMSLRRTKQRIAYTVSAKMSISVDLDSELYCESILFIGENKPRGARWRRWLARSAAIVVVKQLSQWSVIGWVTKNFYLEFLRASEGTLSRWSRLHLQSLAPANPHWARVVGHGPISLFHP